MKILSIQSSVAYGYVGNSAATFPLQRLGHEVWPVLTVHFSNHTGYGAWRGTVLDPAIVTDVIEGINDRGALGSADAILTGYQGSPGVAGVVLATVERVRALNPAAVYCCDPVLGDVGRGFFVAPGIPELMRDSVVPQADIITPNAYELAFLAGVPSRVAASGAGLQQGGSAVSEAFAPDGSVNPLIYDPEPFVDSKSVLAAVDRVISTGPTTVLVTSVEYVGLPADSIAMIAVDRTGAYEVRTPRLPLSINGAGDVTAALFLAHLMSDGIAPALAKVASTIFAILALTHEVGAREIRLVDAQVAIAHPACEFEVVRLR